jgi:hypothetical protein
MVVDVRPPKLPVNIFINAPLNSPVTISANANLCSDSSGSTDVKSCLGTVASTSPSAIVTPTGSWSRLRLFGNALPTPSAPCNQPIQLNTSPDNSTIPVNRLNLQNAFLWFPAATLSYPPALASSLAYTPVSASRYGSSARWREGSGLACASAASSVLTGASSCDIDSSAPSACTAAAFLRTFAEKTPWAHLDIAYTAFRDKDNSCMARGATGFAVRTLVELATRWQ